MMYRIILNPTTSKWTIQISGMFLRWKTLCSGELTLEFSSFADARTYTEAIGLDQVYSYHGPSMEARTT